MQAQAPEPTCLSYKLYYLQVNKGTPEQTEGLNIIYSNPLVFYIRKLLLFSHSVISDISDSTPGFPVLHYLPEFAQTHVH